LTTNDISKKRVVAAAPEVSVILVIVQYVALYQVQHVMRAVVKADVPETGRVPREIVVRDNVSRAAVAAVFPNDRHRADVNKNHLAGAADFKTVTGTEYRKATVSRPARGFPPIYIKETRRPAVVICGAVSCNPTLSARDAAASRLAVVRNCGTKAGWRRRARHAGALAKAG
jgi:hypothetical protein